MGQLPIGVLISGQGTNLRAILERCASGELDAQVRVVMSNRPAAPGLAYSRERGIPTFSYPRADYPDRTSQQREMASALRQHGVELVVLAGFDQILSDKFVHEFSFRIINLHPSLLPAFGAGMHAVRDALEHGAKVTGCTVHFVAEEFPATDSGPIVLQESVPIEEDDTEASLLTRVHEAEYRLLPAAIQLFAQRRLVVEGRRVRILAPAS